MHAYIIDRQIFYELGVLGVHLLFVARKPSVLQGHIGRYALKRVFFQQFFNQIFGICAHFIPELTIIVDLVFQNLLEGVLFLLAFEGRFRGK